MLSENSSKLMFNICFHVVQLYKALAPYAKIAIDDLEDTLSLNNVDLAPARFVEMSNELDKEGGKRKYISRDHIIVHHALRTNKMNTVQEV